MATGNLIKADTNSFAVPCQVDGSGNAIHRPLARVVEQISSLTDTAPKNPNTFAFWKGLNAAAGGGVLTTDVQVAFHSMSTVLPRSILALTPTLCKSTFSF
jgi:hypothetical protein